MKLVTAVVRAHRLDEVRQALAGVGVAGMTVTEVRGFGQGGGHVELYRGAEYVVDHVPMLKLEVAVSTPHLAEVLDAIMDAATTGRIGDGKVFIADLVQVVRIRTGELDDDAL